MGSKFSKDRPRKKQTTKLLRFIIDAGNAWIKWVIGQQEGIYVHSMALLSPHEYQDGIKRFGRTASADFMKLDGQAYAIGATAENWQVQKRVGAPKYTREYYGPLFCNAIARTFRHIPDEINGQKLYVVASHASRDYRFSDQLVESITGKWDFECDGQRFKFEVVDVETYEEPFGGYAMQAFQRKSNGWVAKLHGTAVGIVDIGGGTCGVLAIDENGNVQYGSADSGNMGMNNVTDRMTDLLKQEHPEIFQMAKTIPIDRVRSVITTGRWIGGGHNLPLEPLVEIAVAPLMNEVQNLYLNRLNGGLGVDVLVLTGGGNAVLNERVSKLLSHNNTILADVPEVIQFANVRGTRNFYEVLDAVG